MKSKIKLGKSQSQFYFKRYIDSIQTIHINRIKKAPVSQLLLGLVLAASALLWILFIKVKNLRAQ